MTIFSRPNKFLWIALPIAGILATGCTTTTTQSFNVVEDTKVEFSSVAAGADFSKYDRLFAADMGILFPSDAAPSLEDQQRIRQIFREAFRGELAGYKITEEKGPTTLEIQATIIDYRSAEVADVSNLRRELRDVARAGALLFLMEMKDAQSGELLARAGDSAMAPALSASSDTTTDWSAVEEAALHWAKLFRQFVDNNLGK
jgi:hypothetical protein